MRVMNRETMIRSSDELVVIDDSRHFVMLDQPQAFQAALDKSLSSH